MIASIRFAKRTFGILVLGAALCTAVAAATGEDLALQAIREAEAADAAYWNALYVWLRVAGVAWVALEWVAAILLWRGYRLISAALRARGLVA